jgi:YHS domain-containing protein
MFKAYVMPAVAGAFLLGLATAAGAVTGEFGNMCAASLAAGKDTQTDCSINAQIEGKTYCFGSKEAMTEFMKAPKENLAKAKAYYSSKHPG